MRLVVTKVMYWPCFLFKKLRDKTAYEGTVVLKTPLGLHQSQDGTHNKQDASINQHQALQKHLTCRYKSTSLVPRPPVGKVKIGTGNRTTQ